MRCREAKDMLPGSAQKEDEMDKVTGFEIPVVNMLRAKKFYSSAFGWKVDIYDDEYSHIKTVAMDKNWMPKEKGAVNGGMFKRRAKKEKPLILVTVDSVKKTVAKVKKAGGKIITDMTQAGEWGWWAEVADLEGNVFELWQDAK
jgi:predicted enzyme related to lactoylglutathione lyase